MDIQTCLLRTPWFLHPCLIFTTGNCHWYQHMITIFLRNMLRHYYFSILLHCYTIIHYDYYLIILTNSSTSSQRWFSSKDTIFHHTMRGAGGAVVSKLLGFSPEDSRCEFFMLKHGETAFWCHRNMKIVKKSGVDGCKTNSTAILPHNLWISWLKKCKDG